MFGDLDSLIERLRNTSSITTVSLGRVDSVGRVGARFPSRPLPSSSTNTYGSADWQRAMRFGQREVANPGRNGQERSRYTHDGTVYLIEEGCRLVDSWQRGGATRSDSHTVFVVDCSGSMRKDDVSGYSSRTEAVYECLARDFVQPQLAKSDLGDAWVSLVEMNDTASIIFERKPLTAALADTLKDRGAIRARSHGNYLPALDCALSLVRSDAKRGTRVLLVFLSDGEPSDHNCMKCEHGVAVWENDTSGRIRPNGRAELRVCPFGGSNCRRDVKRKVHNDCLAQVQAFGELLGRDKVVVGTVAFGPVQEDFTILAEMAKQVPRGHFQKLSIAASALRTAFTSLTSDLTALRTEAVGPLTVRNVEVREDDGATITETLGNGFNKYTMKVNKYKYDMKDRDLVAEPFIRGACGIAYYKTPFASGAERLVYRCTEISVDGTRKGLKLVCKEARHEQMMGLKFHKKCARVQTRAAQLAEEFNKRHGGPVSWNVFFVPCFIYEFPPSYVLAEAELEGRWRKWNNNAGGVTSSHQASLQAISEGSDDDGSENENENEDKAMNVDEIPQCFSHFTYVHSLKRELVCDLQGVWNEIDGFTFTDPVVHYVSETGQRHHNGATDK